VVVVGSASTATTDQRRFAHPSAPRDGSAEWAADAPQDVPARLGARTATALAVRIPPSGEEFFGGV
jgi:hypothetical protein